MSSCCEMYLNLSFHDIFLGLGSDHAFLVGMLQKCCCALSACHIEMDMKVCAMADINFILLCFIKCKVAIFPLIINQYFCGRIL